jgi:hypothetical protein
VTSFADRENAIEAYFAYTALGNFNERVRRRKALLLRIAERAGLSRGDTKSFVAKLSGLCATNCRETELSAALATELAERGIVLSPATLREAAATSPETLVKTEVEPVPQSWAEYVAEQVFLLFAGRRGADQARELRGTWGRK